MALRISILSFLILSSVSASDVGPFRKCNSENLTDLNNCLVQSFNEKLKPVITSGIPEWEIPSADPWNYKSAPDIKIGDFENSFSDMQIRGLSKMVITSISVNPSTMTVKMDTSIPEVRLTGQYKLKGQIFALKLGGQGPFWTIMNNVSSTIEQKLVTKDTDPSIQVESALLDLKFGKIRSRFNQLFNGDPILGETVNAFINENTSEFIDNYKPVLTEPFISILNGIISRVLSDISIDKFLHMKD